MGFNNPRAICPNCGGKIHTQAAGPFAQRTGTTCQLCGVALTGKVSWTNRAELAVAAPTMTEPTQPKYPSTGPGRVKFASRHGAVSGTSSAPDALQDLERLARLREAGALTEAEFEAEKARILGRSR